VLGLVQRGRTRARQERAGFTMYSAAVQAARDTWFYQPPPDGLGVADTLDGRFDLISLHAFLVIRQLRRQPDPGAAIAQAVFDAMFSDMDRNLREMGVGDLGVSKRVRSMWEAFHGRASAYEAGLDAAERDGDESALAEALARNIWRGGAVPGLDRRTSERLSALSSMWRIRGVVGSGSGMSARPGCEREDSRMLWVATAWETGRPPNRRKRGGDFSTAPDAVPPRRTLKLPLKRRARGAGTVRARKLGASSLASSLEAPSAQLVHKVQIGQRVCNGAVNLGARRRTSSAG